MLIDSEEYLSAGVHIGTKQKSSDMRRFIYKVRPDGLAVLNVGVIDSKIKKLAMLLSKYKPEEVLLVSTKKEFQDYVKKFIEFFPAKTIIERFAPGTLTNPKLKEFVEPKIILVVSPIADSGAIKEAAKSRIAVAALCNTQDATANIDYIVPCNNNGKKSVALIIYLLAKELKKDKVKLPSFKEFYGEEE